jgi:hypothetical protein
MPFKIVTVFPIETWALLSIYRELSEASIEANTGTPAKRAGFAIVFA